jgi:GntR family transcriptional regulator / MocR family aminotransferase
MDFERLLSDIGPAGKLRGHSRQQRLYELIKRAILDGRLCDGAKLPSTRQLAATLHIARNSVIFAYELLQAEGFLVTANRATCVAALNLVTHQGASQGGSLPIGAPLSKRSQQLSRTAPDSEYLPFISGVPELNLFPWKKWLSHVLQAWRAVGARHLSYTAPGGLPGLRTAIARHMRLSRGLVCTDAQVLITSGTQMALDICARMLADSGDLVWMESPGYPPARSSFRSAGLRIADIPVDDKGMCCEGNLVQSHAPRIVFVTPSHQYPLGSVLSLERRLALLEQAQKHQLWIIENDYDSEFQHDGHQISALQELAPNAPVIYIGTFSKSVFPGLRLGFMVVPTWAADPIASGLHHLYRPGQAIEQMALASFIESGHLAQHLRHMRKVYLDRRNCLRQQLLEHFGDLIQIFGGAAGMHLTLLFRRTVDDCALVAKAASLGVTTRALSDFYVDSLVGAKPSGLILGYGAADQRQIIDLVPRLRTAYDRVTGL